MSCLARSVARLSQRGPGAVGGSTRQFLIDVESTIRELLEREDLDGNFQITLDDNGPKVYAQLPYIYHHGYSQTIGHQTWIVEFFRSPTLRHRGQLRYF
jgi:hypothetical protein